MKEVGRVLTNDFLEFCKKYGRELQLWFEPGKFLVSEAGTFLTTANVVKIDPIKTFIGVNSGLNHLGRPMMYGSYHDIFNASNPDESEQNEYRVVGYICETDTFSWTPEGKQGERLMNKVTAGDIIAIKNAGAYCFSMASQYNSRLLPAEVLVHEGEAKLIRKRDTFEDIVRNLVDVDV
jgi:diaminopimelate decarboxylase